MAVILQMTYMKKLGLPNFSSHSCSVSLTVEIPDVSVAAQESVKLYSLLQTAVDAEIQEVGFMPNAESYGMQNGNGHQLEPRHNGHNGNSHHRPSANTRNGDSWNCTEGQRGFIQRIINDNQLNKDDVERMSFDLFGVGMMACNKMQMSQLIDDLLERTGKPSNGRRRWTRQPAELSMIAVADPLPASTSAPPQPTQSEIISRLQQTVSASRLSLFLSCRLKFYFRYVQGFKKAKTASLHVGGAVHAVLKAWNKARWRREPLTLKQLHEEFVKAWTNQTDEPVQWDDGEEAEENKVGWRLLETYIRESKIPPELVPDAVEVPVEADLHEHGLPTLIGVLDLVQGGIIVDYKTSGQTPNAERAVHTHEVQTSGYAVLYRASTGNRENGIEVHTLVKLKTPKLVTTSSPPMSEQQQTRLFRLIEAYQHGLDVRDFIPSPGLQCVACEFFNECRAWH